MKGQEDKESRALAGLAFDPDTPAVHLNQAAGDGQTQTCAALFFASSIGCLAEFFEYDLMILFMDAWPAVADAE